MTPLLSGCGAPPDGDDIEETDQALTQDSSIPVDFGVQRALHRECSTKCASYKTTHPKPNYTVKVCTKWVPDCGVPWSIALFADAGARSASQTFPAFNEDPAWRYLGCGPQAAQNVLAFYGIKKSIVEVARSIRTINFSSSSIATAPDDLVSGLQSELDAWGQGTYKVQRRSYVDIRWEVRQALNKGNPVILLVQGGKHYQVVTSLVGWEYTLIDYPGSGDHIVDFESGLGLDLSLPGWFASGYRGYNPNTIITITRS